MTRDSFMAQIEANEVPYCAPPPRESDLNPILDQEKQSSFQPDIHSYVTLDAKFYEDRDYSIELNAKYFDSTMQIYIHEGYGHFDEAVKYLKHLNKLTGDMLDFLKRHDIRSKSQE